MLIEGVEAGAEFRVFSFLDEPEVEPSGEGRGVLVDEARDIDRSKPVAADAESCEFNPTPNQRRVPKRGGQVRNRMTWHGCLGQPVQFPSRINKCVNVYVAPILRCTR